MVSAPRLLLIAIAVASIPVYLAFMTSEGLLVQVAGAVVILFLVSLVLFTGRSPIAPDSRKSISPNNEQVDFGDIELPDSVLSDESASKSPVSELRRTRGRKQLSEIDEFQIPEPLHYSADPSNDETSPITDFEEEIEGLAKVHIARSDPELLAEAEVDRYLEKQRSRRAEFRERMIRERRRELSERISANLRKWSELEDGEDLSTITKIPDSGLIVFYEPEDHDPTIPQGTSYVRIDDNRVLKVRISLDVPKNITLDEERTKFSEMEEMPPPSHLDSGMPLPPLLPPEPPDLPLRED